MSRRQRGSIKAGVFVAAVALVFFLTTGFPAWAALGGDVASIQADQLHMQGSRNMMAADSYTVHEIQAASSTVVREYASSNGKVFAVTFHGPWPPDLRQLLGNYFDQYSRAMHAQNSLRRGRHPVMIDEPGLSVHIGGHPRAFAGKAYAPDLLPTGVRAEDIQ